MIENGSSLQLEIQWLRDRSSMLMERVFISQYEFYWKRHDLKNALKKEIF